MSIIKTVSTTNGINTISFDEFMRYFWIKNIGTTTVYASAYSNAAENADGTVKIDPGESVRVDNVDNVNIYIVGAGSVEIHAQNEIDCPFKVGLKGGGNELNGAPSYSVDAVDYPLLGLNLYGKSVQDGTPTPDAPVDIVSVGDNGFDIITKDDKHFNLLSVRDNGGDIITKQPVSTAVKNGEIFQFSFAAAGTGYTHEWQWSADKGITWNKSTIQTAVFSAPAMKSYNGYLYRCIVTDSNGNVEISDEATLYVVSDDCEVKTASIATDALQLCGILVSEGGNYSDSNGQQWIADELIYNADGTGKIIKRIEKIKLSSGNMNKYEANNKRAMHSIQQHIVDGNSLNYTKCNCLIPAHGGGFSYETGGKYYINNQLLFVYTQNFGIETELDWKNYVDNNDFVVYHAVKTPTIIELTAAEVNALRTLQTFDGMTSISNSAGAEMSVKYCTNKALSEYVLPITKGLQSQIDELRAAVLSLGGNV